MSRALVRTAAAALIAVAHPAWAAPPDFSSIRSQDGAAQAAEQGQLVRILLFPAELGGEDIPMNAAFVPAAAAESRSRVIAEISRRVEEGMLNQMEVEPEYRADSVVPARIRYRAWNSRTGAEFVQVIEIW